MNNLKLDRNSIRTFHSLLEKRAELSPNDAAVRYYEQIINYSEYNNRANQFARHLQNLGIRKGVLVGIYVDRCLELPIITMGILKAGAVCVPLDIQSPPARLESMLQKAGLTYIVIHPNYLKLSENIKCDHYIHIIEYDTNILQQYSIENLNLELKSEDLAFILYTSGSTGEPKGVELEHRGLINTGFELIFEITTSAKSANVFEHCNVLQISSISFDVMIAEICTAIIVIGILVIAKQEDILPTFPLANFIDKYEISFVFTSPSILKLIEKTKLPTLKVVVSGGEVCPSLFANAMSKKCIFFNGYGPTEASIYATIYHVDKNIEYKKTIPIGHPLNNVEIRIVDSGELHIGGPGVARGYHNNAELTAKSFYISEDGKTRFYKTGDVVKFSEDGNLEYIGRIDRQVKYHSVRIHLEEIEKIIKGHNCVEIAAIVMCEDNLVAFIQLKSDQILDQVSIRAYLRNKLPERMLPNKYFFVPTIGLTTSGKIDYQSLEHFYRKNISTFKVTPIRKIDWSDKEYKLLKILQSFTEYDQTELDTDFFNLGIDSFSIVNFVDVINETFDINLPISKIYEYPIIKKLADYINSLQMGTVTNSIDFSKEVCIDSILSKNKYIYFSKSIAPKNILLTGVTGFIGIFLLDELLRKTNATIYCLIRTSDMHSAYHKLEMITQMYKIDLQIKKYSLRIKFVMGDLTENFFGLKEKEFIFLNSEIDIIYHLAADTNFAKSYKAMRPTNVFGTAEILRFATLDKIIPIHYASTLAIFGCIYFFEKVEELDELAETRKSAPYLKYDIGYVQSKWVADELMQEAMRRGVPITIYRLGFSLCHSKTGITATNQFLYNVINESLHLGGYPNFHDLRQELVSVDFICRSIMYLSGLKESIGKSYHLCSNGKDNATTTEIFEKIEKIRNIKLQQLSYKEWLDLLTKDLSVRKGNNGLRPFFDILKTKVYKDFTFLEMYQNSPTINSSYTLGILEKAGIFIDSIDELLNKLF